MTAQILTVDFQNKVLLEHLCIPKVTRLQCDACKTIYKHTEGSPDNMPIVPFTKEVVMQSGKNKANITVRVCKSCCIQLGNMFGEDV